MRTPPGMRRRNRIAGQFAARGIEMLEAPAYRELSLSAHRALARIEIELAHHGGYDNGRLPVTFEQFEEYGLHRHAVGPLCASCRRSASSRSPSRGARVTRRGGVPTCSG